MQNSSQTQISRNLIRPQHHSQLSNRFEIYTEHGNDITVLLCENLLNDWATGLMGKWDFARTEIKIPSSNISYFAEGLKWLRNHSHGIMCLNSAYRHEHYQRHEYTALMLLSRDWLHIRFTGYYVILKHCYLWPITLVRYTTLVGDSTWYFGSTRLGDQLVIQKLMQVMSIKPVYPKKSPQFLYSGLIAAHKSGVKTQKGITSTN